MSNLRRQHIAQKGFSHVLQFATFLPSHPAQSHFKRRGFPRPFVLCTHHLPDKMLRLCSRDVLPLLPSNHALCRCQLFQIASRHSTVPLNLLSAPSTIRHVHDTSSVCNSPHNYLQLHCALSRDLFGSMNEWQWIEISSRPLTPLGMPLILPAISPHPKLHLQKITMDAMGKEDILGRWRRRQAR